MNVKGSITNQTPVFVKAGEKSAGKESTVADEAIRASIITNLTWYAHLPIEKVVVAVKSGYVELTGQVQWMYQKMVIAAMVQKIEGVTGIINNIAVRFKSEEHT